MDEEPVDRGSQLRQQQGAATESVAALALATVSLMGVTPAQLFGQSMIYHAHDFRGLAAGPGVTALVAIAGGWLGRRQLAGSDVAWTRSLGAAAVVIAAIALVINIAAFISIVTVGQANFIGG